MKLKNGNFPKEKRLLIMRKVFFLISLIFATTLSFAQDFKIDVNAPQVVAVGEAFRVEFAMNGKPEDFTAPSFDSFEVLAGPSVSQSSSMSFVNGKRTSSSSYTYSYVLVASEKGNKEIGAASAINEKKTYKSKPLPIEIVEEKGGTEGGAATNRSVTSVGKDDIILLMDLSKSNAYKGEAVLARVKLLTRATIVGIEGSKIPSFAGFWQQEINDQNKQIQWTRETYNDKIYESGVLKEFLLFPQQDGKIIIDPMTINLVVRIEDSSMRTNSMFDSFFGGGGYRDIRKIVSTESVSINVKPYPSNAPASFSGAVGEFTMNGSLSSDIIAANGSSNLIITINGSGNIPLVSEPKVDLPTSFELYKVSSEENINVSSSGVRGTKTFTYPFIARAKGEYTISPTEFTYFSPENGRFITLSTSSFKMGVTEDTSAASKGGGQQIITGVTREELKILGSDIRHIMTAAPSLKPDNSFFFGSVTYFFIIAILILLTVAAVYILRKVISESKDTVRVKSKKANKVALSRLKEAKGALDKNDSAVFHDAVLKAMWGYVADKLNISQAELSRDNVTEQLSARGVSPSEIEEFMSIITACEEARYAPVTSGTMTGIYDKGAEVITQFENKI